MTDIDLMADLDRVPDVADATRYTLAGELEGALEGALDVEAPPPAEPFVDLPPMLAAPRVSLMGEAGTGKTWMARAVHRQWPGTVLASTTGIAAVNLGEGTTINGLLGYYDTASLRDLYLRGALTSKLCKLAMSGVKRILIDEVSMMDGDQLTILTDALNEMNGEGYVLDEATAKRLEARDLDPISLMLVGDFAQLPPVKAPFAFESAHWHHYAAASHKLTEIRRQADRDFILAIQAARRGDADTACDYFGPRMVEQADPDFPGTTILATNDAVARFNHLRLLKVKGPTYTFSSIPWGIQRGDWKNIPPLFDLKVGTLVMLLSNLRYPGCNGEPGAIKYANGDLGAVEYIDPGQSRIGVRLQRNDRVVEVEWVTRTNKIPLEPGRRKALTAEGLEGCIDEKEEIIGTITYLPLRLAYATTVHKCANPDTKVVVHRRGVIPLERVRPGDYIDTGGGVLARVKALAWTEKPLFRLTTHRGYSVLTTEDHRWATEDGMKETQTLHPGIDRVRLTEHVVVEGTQEVDSETAWWIGAVLGDGCVTDKKEGQIHFAGMEPVLRDQFMRVAQQLGGRPNTRRDERGCHLSSLPVRLRLERWGMDYVTAVHKKVPRVIWESGRAAWAACLRGLFDTDGSVDGTKGRLLYATRSPHLADDVQLLLLYLGIPSTRGTYMGRTGEYFHIRITSESVDQYRALIGFTYPKKVDALAKWHPNRIIRRFDGLDTVAKLEAVSVIAPVLDVELETIHELSFNGIVGSNSQGLSLDRVQVDIREGFFKAPSMVYVALSRARTMEGLRLVGNAGYLRGRCTVAPKVVPWL